MRHAGQRRRAAARWWPAPPTRRSTRCPLPASRRRPLRCSAWRSATAARSDADGLQRRCRTARRPLATRALPRRPRAATPPPRSGG
ncbi:MAG: hypothetical protein MZW92_25980 [Comamonadaceae bacterium]|nr:hypothetical protein [Comamonadaceae bacterium]